MEIADIYRTGLPMRKYGAVMLWTPDGLETNVRHRVIHHSESGYEWGYSGSGPSDLALNILHNTLLIMEHKGHRVECFKGKTFALAFDLHIDFKFQYIAGLPRSGDVISWPDIRQWILDHATAENICPWCSRDHTVTVMVARLYRCDACDSQWEISKTKQPGD